MSWSREKEKKKKSEVYQKIINGELAPENKQKGWTNLEKRKSFNAWDKDKLHEVSVKGGQAVQKLYGKKKTAREALEGILTLKASDEIIAASDIPEDLINRLKRSNPDLTVYDLIQAAAVGRAVEGNMKSYELIRDTYGDKPIEKVEVTENITTNQDRELLQRIAARMDQAEQIQIVETIQAAPETEQKTKNQDE